MDVYVHMVFHVLFCSYMLARSELGARQSAWFVGKSNSGKSCHCRGMFTVEAVSISVANFFFSFLSNLI